MKVGDCIHFNGIQNDKCKAGVCYKDLCKGERLNIIPCIGDRPGVETAVCQSLTPVTAAEVAERQEAWRVRMEMHAKVSPLVVSLKKKHRGRNWQGVETCPCCGGRLQLSIAACNGHCHGRCETEGCLQWME